MANARIHQQGQALGQPFLFPADGFGIVATRDPDAQSVGEPGAGREQVGAAVIDFGVLFVPEDVAALGVEEHDALREGLDRVAQTAFGLAGLALGVFEGVLVPSSDEGGGGRPKRSQAPSGLDQACSRGSGRHEYALRPNA